MGLVECFQTPEGRTALQCGAGCKECLRCGQTPATIFCIALFRCIFFALSNITVTRRRNVLALFQDHAEKALAGGAGPKGLEQAFAARLQISPSMWSQIKSARPIGDKLARQIEQLCGRPPGWLDEERAASVITPAEQQFLDLALRAFRATSSAGRKALRARLQAMVPHDAAVR